MSEVNNSAPAAPAASAAPAPAAAPSDQVNLNEIDSAADAITPEEEAELSAEEQAAAQAAKPAESSGKMKLKIDGEEVELTEEEVKKYASLGKAAQKRMQEAASVRKEHEKLQKDVTVFLDMLKNDPGRVLTDMGVDPKKFAEDMINKQIEDSAKTPEQKEREALQKQLEDAQKKIQDSEEAKRKEQSERLQSEVATKIERDINEALDSGNIPKQPYMVRKVADLMILATAQGIDIEAKDVIPLAKKQIIEEFRSITGVIPEELLEEILGNDKVASLRRRYIKKLRSSPVTAKDVKQTGQEKLQNEKPKEKIDAKTFFKRLGSF